MPSVHFDPSALIKVTNLSFNGYLLRQTKELNINPSLTLERCLAEYVNTAQTKKSDAPFLLDVQCDFLKALDFVSQGY